MEVVGRIADGHALDALEHADVVHLFQEALGGKIVREDVPQAFNLVVAQIRLRQELCCAFRCQIEHGDSIKDGLENGSTPAAVSACRL
mgnify:CR=1 FL=1